MKRKRNWKKCHTNETIVILPTAYTDTHTHTHTNSQARSLNASTLCVYDCVCLCAIVCMCANDECMLWHFFELYEFIFYLTLARLPLQMLLVLENTRKNQQYLWISADRQYSYTYVRVCLFFFYAEYKKWWKESRYRAV